MSFSKTYRALRDYDYIKTLILAAVGYLVFGVVIVWGIFHFPDGAGLAPALIVLIFGAVFTVQYMISDALRKQNEFDIWSAYHRDRAAFIANFEQNRADSTYPLEQALKGFDMVHRPFYS